MIKKEVLLFFLVGTLTVLVDFLSYRALALSQLLNVEVSKGASFLIGTVFAYFANRFWTFSSNTHAQGSVLRFVILYTLTLCVNIIINTIVLTLLDAKQGSIEMAFISATAASATLNFLGLKFFVFKSVHIPVKL